MRRFNGVETCRMEFVAGCRVQRRRSNLRRRPAERTCSWLALGGSNAAYATDVATPLTFTLTNAKITRVEVIGDPARLRELDIAVL